MTAFELVEAKIQDEPVLRQLLELYAHDFSAYNGADVDPHGRYGYRSLDSYWTEPDATRFSSKWTAASPDSRSYDRAHHTTWRSSSSCGSTGDQGWASKRRGSLARFPGEWQVRELAANKGATAFWHVAIPVPFTEDANHEGPVQHFTMDAAAPTRRWRPRSRLRTALRRAAGGLRSERRSATRAASVCARSGTA